MTARALEPFQFHTHAIRVIVDEHGEPWFLANDVCTVLGYKNARDAIAKHCRPEGVAKRDTPTESGIQEMTYINEGNLYRLIIKSRKPEAEPFEAWVCDEVLPAIRKTGQYNAILPEPPAISKAQQGILFNLVAGKADSSGKSRAYYWARFANHFKLSSYKDLPADKFDEAHDYLRKLEGEEMFYLTKDELEAKVKAIAGELLDKEPDLFLTDSGYRKEARDAINQHLDTCHAEMKAAGVEPPKWPVMDEKTIDGLSASAFFGRRWIASFDHHTIKPHLTHVPDNAFIMTEAQFIQMLKERGFLVIKKRDVLQKLEA